jgi:aryl-alcohol dehydrogenase-like predicted oxidoreductase
MTPPSMASSQLALADDAEFIAIPSAQLRVGRVALGTSAMGGSRWGGVEERDSVATIHGALDRGVNLIDTAPVYGFGIAEEVVGKALAGPGLRARAIIATKAGVEWHEGELRRNAARERILREIDDSLRRLRTDYIDIYQVHWPDPLVPIEETAAAMEALYRQGKIRAIGVSHFTVAQIDRFRQVAPLHVVQSPYNLFERGVEAAVLPYCLAHNIVTVGYSALCRGLLSGRMRADTTFAANDLRRLDPKFRRPRFAQYLAAVQMLDQFARGRFNRRVIHLAVRWMLDQGIGVALWSGRRPYQLGTALGARGWALDASDVAIIERIVVEAVYDPVGPGFTEAPPRL